MGHVRPTANGTWEARYRAPDGKERARRFPTKTAARKYLERVSADRQRDAWIDPTGAKLTVREWVDRWSPTMVDLRPSTRARDEANLRNHVLPRFGGTRLGAMNHLEIREWITDLSGSGLAPATVQKIHQVLSKMLRAAVDARKIPNNPADRVPLPKIEREEMRFLVPAEVHELVPAMPARWQALVLFDCYAGLRMGELCGLRRGRLHLARNEVRVAEIGVEVRGDLQFGPPKTGAGRRTVPIPGFVADALQRHLDEYVEDRPDAFVFAGEKGGALRANPWRSRVWNKSVKAAQLWPLRPHDMRHTAVSMWIAAGASPKQVATWAGHTSVSVVLDRYGHLFPGNADPVLARLAELHDGL